MAVAGGLHSAEWEMHFGADGGRVDVSDSSLEIAYPTESFVDIFGVKRGRKAVLDVVGDFDGVCEIFAGDDGNHRAEDFFLGDAHFRIDVGENGRLHKVAVSVVAAGEAIAAALEACTFGFADVDIFKIGRELVFVDGGAHLGFFVEAVADFQMPGKFDITLDELAVDAFLDDDATGCGAALAGGTESTPEAAFDGELEVGVVEHDHGILAAEFERTMFEALGCDLAYNSAYGAGSGQRNGFDVGMLRQRAAYFGAETSDDVDDAFGQAGVDQGADEVKSGKRGVLSGLDDTSVAADDGWQQLPGWNCHGEIPRGDHAADAERLADGHGKLVGKFGGGGGAEHAAAFAGHVVGGVDGLLDVAASFFQHFAHFAGHVTGEFFFAAQQDFGGAIDDLGAARSRHQSPLFEGMFGGLDGGFNIRRTGLLEDADHVTSVGGIAIFESVAGRGFDPFAINEILINLGAGGRAHDRGAGQNVGCHKSLLGVRETGIFLCYRGGLRSGKRVRGLAAGRFAARSLAKNVKKVRQPAEVAYALKRLQHTGKARLENQQ